MDILEIMKARHSVRAYDDKPIEAEKRVILDALTEQINRENGLSIQIIYDEPKCFDSIMAHYGKFSGTANYIALVGKKSKKLDETLGYYGEMLALKAQELGLNTCWVAMTHGKSLAKVERGEKEVCIIALGYGKNCGAVHKSKQISEVCNLDETSPEWFLKGMEAALTAPTAMNQQKFYFELTDGQTVKATCKKGFYTKLDLGIVRYHFEAVSGVKTVS